MRHLEVARSTLRNSKMNFNSFGNSIDSVNHETAIENLDSLLELAVVL